MTTNGYSDYRFTDTVAAHLIEEGVSLDAVLEGLEAGHFKQPGYELGRFTHYLKVEGRPVRVITGPHHTMPEVQAIIGVTVLTR